MIEFLEYWLSIYPLRGLPLQKDFDPTAIPSLLATTFLVDVLPDDRFVFRLVGSDIEDHHQVYAMAGMSPADFSDDDPERVLAPYRMVRDYKCVYYRTASQSPAREPSRCLYLPLCDDAGSVTTIIGNAEFGVR